VGSEAHRRQALGLPTGGHLLLHLILEVQGLERERQACDVGGHSSLDARLSLLSAQESGDVDVFLGLASLQRQDFTGSSFQKLLLLLGFSFALLGLLEGELRRVRKN